MRDNSHGKDIADAVAFFLVQWQVALEIKMPVIILASFVVTAALYELVIRRVAPLAALFGTKAVGRPAAAPPHAATPAAPY